MKDIFKKLMTVKSIVTILLSVIFAILSLYGYIQPEQFMTIFTVIIGFYFGTQHEKHKGDGGNE